MKDKLSIETYIRQEKTVCPSSGLPERIMETITTGPNENVVNRWIHLSGMAASIVIALWLGLSLERHEAQKASSENKVWNINDIQTENLTLLYNAGNE